MRRIVCSRFKEGSSRKGGPGLDSSSGLTSCWGTSGSAITGTGTMGSGWAGSLVGCAALQGMLGSEASVRPSQPTLSNTKVYAHCQSPWAETGFSPFLDHQRQHTPPKPMLSTCTHCELNRGPFGHMCDLLNP